jgi:SAM-dependent methyltransferase
VATAPKTSVRRLEEVESRESPERARAVIETVIRRISLLRTPQRGDSFLDIGSAACANSAALAHAGYRPTGAEIVAEFASLARQAHPGIPFVTAAAEELPFADESFDYVLLLSVLEHVHDWRKTLAEAVRVLNRNGVLFATTTNRFCPKQYEIRYLYGFGYLPSSVQRGIYALSMRHWPALVHHTDLPAYNWFSHGQLARELQALGANPHHWLSLVTDDDIPSRFRRPVLYQLTRFAMKHPVWTTAVIVPTTTVLAQKQQ